MYNNKEGKKSMKEEKLFIGSHVSLAAPSYFAGCVEEAVSYGANTFMFYTGAPQNTTRKPTSELNIDEGKKLCLEHGIDLSKVVVHAPYVINGANVTKPEMRSFAKDTIVSELRRTNDFGVCILVLHPGAHVGAGAETAIKQLAEVLNEVFDSDGTNVKIALETMAGKGSEIGSSFEQIAQIIALSRHPDRLGVCLDTCHMNDAGYDVFDIDALLEEFDRVVGIKRILCVHINDSKNVRGANKDRHENIGYGEIGFNQLYRFVHYPLLDGIPKILETPYINGHAPYKIEIEMLKSGHYIDGWKSQFENDN